MLAVYPEDKLNAIVKYLVGVGVSVADDLGNIRVWSDDSITVGNNDITEFYVARYEGEYPCDCGRCSGEIGELMTEIDGFRILKKD